ncbi:protein lin-37 homolog [Drosophila grimshawi]|uniref:GH11218 n=1 Tax=Drosophila grimshawi TaxID=7222 RepID=B4JDN4_DROGR|nr:protein lin-37 homolog [Drosophila grimshawi]EDW03404.1 GH11218 [Drosophila grimshawi]
MKVTPKQLQLGASAAEDAPQPLPQKKVEIKVKAEPKEKRVPNAEKELEDEAASNEEAKLKLEVDHDFMSTFMSFKVRAEQKATTCFSATSSAASSAASSTTASADDQSPGSRRSKAKRLLSKKTVDIAEASPSSSRPDSVMPWFERRLDQSQHGNERSLYSMSRDWVSNLPLNASASTKKNSNSNGDSSIPMVMPEHEDDAEKVLAQQRSGELKVLKHMPKARETDMLPIPIPLPVTQNWDLEGASKQQLLADNMKRWKRVRNHWQKHNQEYEHARYETIDQILKIIIKK